MRALRILLAAAISAAVLAVSLAPQFRLALVDPITQLIALRPWLALGALIGALAAAVVGFVQYRRARLAPRGTAKKAAGKPRAAARTASTRTHTGIRAAKSRTRGGKRPAPRTGSSTARSRTGSSPAKSRTGAARSRARASSRPGPARPVTALILAIGLALSAVINMAVLAGRGLDPAARISLEDLASQPEAEGEITVVAINALWDNVAPVTVARLALASFADVIFLPEGSAQLARDTGALLASSGAGEWQVIDQAAGSDSAILVSAALGTYRRGDAPEGSAMALPDGAGPPLAAAHPFPPPAPWPLGRSGRSIQDWAAEVRTAVGMCRELPGGILAGDFNATLDHPVLSSRCGFVSVTEATGAAGWGTWPRSVPALLGTPIDHVFVDPARWNPVHTWIVDVVGSDHRAVVARLAEVPALGG